MRLSILSVHSAPILYQLSLMDEKERECVLNLSHLSWLYVVSLLVKLGHCWFLQLFFFFPYCFQY